MKPIALACFVLITLSSCVMAQDWYWGHKAAIVSIDLIDGKLHVTKRQASPYMYPEGGGPQDTIYKEIYAASNGVIVLERKVDGTVIPPQLTPEKIEWPDAESRKDTPSPWQNYTNLVCSSYCIIGSNAIGSNALINMSCWKSAGVAWSFKGMTLSEGTNGILTLTMDKGMKMSEAASNFVQEVERQLHYSVRMSSY